MDWHKLQQTLFALDPTDPREDLAKLKAQASGQTANVAATKDYVNESVEVPKGSMPLSLDSIADFAALAGIRLDERQKTGSAGQAKGKDPMPKAEPGRTKHPLKDKLVGEANDTLDFIKQQASKGYKNYNTLGAISTGLDPKDKTTSGKAKTAAPTAAQPAETGNLSPALQLKLLPYQDQLERILGNSRAKARFDEFINRLAPPKSQEEGMKNPPIPKPRNPVAAYAQKSGAGAHKDQNKKNQLPRKEKHKGKVPMESIKDMLYRKLAEKK
jgi:hypothetical protein